MHSDIFTTMTRLGVFAELAGQVPRPLGRTALMKLCYFLQESKEVPLGYDFSLYTYGPFDSEVLADLQTAEELQVLNSQFERYSGGYGYKISPGSAAPRARDQASEFLTKHKAEIEWAASTLGSRKPSDLELASTAVFICKQKGKLAESELISLVRAIKPHFSSSDVKAQIQWLRDNNLFSDESQV